ncbi:MAG: class I SAM-dependent methyltransferase [Roseibacillus sp.]
MGEELFEEFYQAEDSFIAGRTSLEGLFSIPQTKSQLHTLFSRQSYTLKTCSEWLTEKVEQLPPEQREHITELGCATGLLSKWLKIQFPHSQITGLDRSPEFIEIARESAPDCHFIEWDYSCGSPPEELQPATVTISALGIDFSLRQDEISIEQTDPPYRKADSYEWRYEEAKRILKYWRASCAEGATLHTILRVPQLIHLLPFIDAAQDAGWQLDLKSSEKVKIEDPYGEDEVMPGLCFKAVQIETSPTRIPEERVTGFWISDSIETTFQNIEAREVYNQLKDGVVTSRKEQAYADGTTKVIIEKTFGTFRIRYSYTSTEYAELEFLPLLQL